VLTLVRTRRRHGEIALRLALGAERKHVARMLVAEVLVLGIIAVAGALGIAHAALALLGPRVQQQLGPEVPGGAAALAIDPSVLLVIAVLGLVIVALLSSLSIGALGQRRLMPRSLRLFGGPLLAIEIAGALALLVGCGLMVRTVVNLVGTDLGFQTVGTVRAHFALPARTYQEPVALVGFYEELTRRVRAQASAAALTNFVVFYTPQKHPIEIDGRGVSGTAAGVIAVGDEYFDVLRIPVTDGRPFTTKDRLGAAPAAIVSQSLAKRLWPGERAVGQRLRTAEQLAVGTPLGAWRTVVGVVADVKQTYTDADLLDIYLPFLQAPSRFASLFVRTDGSAFQWLERLRAIVSDMNPEVTIDSARELSAEADNQLAVSRFLTSLLVGFGVFTSSLALIGVYGVTAYVVEERRREVAIRVALGATVRSINAMLLTSGGKILAGGIVLGLFGAAGLGRVLSSQIHGVERFDVATVAASCALIGIVASLAAYWPANRIARANPTIALKEN
jgi:putative ABC transport system permease protein